MREMFDNHEIIGISYEVNGKMIHEDLETMYKIDDGIRIFTPSRLFVIDSLAEGEQAEMTKRYKVFESDTIIFVHFL